MPVGSAAPAARAAASAAAAATPAQRAALLDRAGGTLVELLDRQVRAHRRLLEHLEEKRDAIRRADLDRVTGCCTAERELLAEIEGLEFKRRDVVVGLTGVLSPGRTDPLPLTEITPHLSVATSARLLELRTGLRTSLEEAGRLSAIVSGAADSVGRHLAGLVQTLGTVLAGPGTYGRRGRVDASASSPMRLDLTS